ncbi:MAG: hypothetical protein KAS30_02185, partial [Candidatus Diapherotrites archaeon]|nr:hypothetical protein [Candidatus Diapherotrites archaeon]
NMAEITAYTYTRQWFDCPGENTIVGYTPLEITIDAPSIVAAVGAYNMVVTSNMAVFDILYTQSTRDLYTTVTSEKIIQPSNPPAILIENGVCGNGIVEGNEECDPPGTLSDDWYVNNTFYGTYYLCGNDCTIQTQQISGTFSVCQQLKQASDGCTETVDKTIVIKKEADEEVIIPIKTSTMTVGTHVKEIDGSACKTNCHVGFTTQVPQPSTIPFYQALELEQELTETGIEEDETTIDYTVRTAECIAIKDTYQDTCLQEPNRVVSYSTIPVGTGTYDPVTYYGTEQKTITNTWTPVTAPKGTNSEIIRPTFTADNNPQCTSGKDGCCYPISDGICDPDCENIYGFCETAEDGSINCSSDPDCTMVSWNPPEITVIGVKVVKMTLNETIIIENMPFEKPVTISATNTISDTSMEMWGRLTMVWENPSTGLKEYVRLTDGESKFISQGIGNIGVGQEFLTTFLPYSPNVADLGGEENLPTTVTIVAEVFEGTCDPKDDESTENCYKGDRNIEGTSGLGLGAPTDAYFGTLGKVQAPIVVTKPALLNIEF